MNSRVMKSLVVAVALAAGVSGIAHADDGDMGRFGDSYAYFNSQPVDKAPSTYHATNPNGVSDRQLEALSSEALARTFAKPSFDKAPSEWRIAHPNGLSDRELQALSYEGAVWHPFNQSATSAVASSNGAVIARTK